MKKECIFSDSRFNESEKPVHVHAYWRFRNGRLEFVKEHFRAGWGTRK